MNVRGEVLRSSSAQRSRGPHVQLADPKANVQPLLLHGSDFNNTLIPKSRRVLISFWEAVPELCRLQFISPRESHTGALARESGRLTDLLFESQKATLLSRHVCGPVLLLGMQAKMKSHGSVLLLRQSSRQPPRKGPCHRKATESLGSIQKGSHRGSLWGQGASSNPVSLIRAIHYLGLSLTHTHTRL